MAGRHRKKLHQAEGNCRFPCASFSDKAKHFSFINGKGNVIDSFYYTVICFIMNDEIVYFNNCLFIFCHDIYPP